MDTYPPEFVIHLQPTLIVTGLLPPEDASKHEINAAEKNSSDVQPTPSQKPVAQSGQQQHTSNPALEAQKAAMLHAMLSKNNVSYWDNTKGLAGSLFYVIPEYRSYILPPTRKFLQQTGQQHLISSSFSPSWPTSPLYPDGLITPLWIRRHREQIPSVFIAFVDLWDRESALAKGSDGDNQRGFSDKGPLGVIDPAEREHDIVLAQELLERRKASQERGVKFAAVILLQRSHMEDPSIEDRLTFVRKSAGLDIKSSFYALGPSNNQEISEFAVNLQRSQYEGSMNYYKEQVKRHKKKKSNLPATTASVKPLQPHGMGGGQQLAQQQQLQQQPLQGLSVQGWMLRYEFKMGMFSECKQDIDNAVKHYESAYGLLIDMFAVTSTITPGASGIQARTKRWAEAKVLADCLCLKICKFHLYLDAPSTALFHFRRHLIVFKAFSESWRMGDDSFEYWAWLGKQYRVFGDLIDIGTKSGFKLPVPSPGSVVYGSFAGMTEGAKDLNKFSGIGLGSGTTGFGIGPSGDAFMYGGNVGGGRGGGTHGPGAGINPLLSLSAERAIDHLALTIELLTKSYEQFKRYKAGRMTLSLASEIAGTYYSAGKFEMALKFFERIGKTYRKEGWNLILTSILKWSVQCAKELGYWENVVEYLIEMLSPDMPTTEEKRQSIFDELICILYTDNHPSNTVIHKPLVLSMPQINSFVACTVQFQKKTAFVSSGSKFQVQLSTQGGQGALPGPFRISYIHVEFTDSALNHWFEDPRSYTQEDAPEDNVKGIRAKDHKGMSIEWKDCRNCTLEQITSKDDEQKLRKAWKKVVSLDICPFETKVLEGIIVPESEQTVRVVKVTLGIVTAHWNVALEFPSQDLTHDPNNAESQQSIMPIHGEPSRRQWLDIVETSSDSEPTTKLRFRNLDNGPRQTPAIRVVPRESKVEIKTLFKSPAYLDEYLAVKIKVRNGETCPVAMEMDVELHPIDPSIESLDSIMLDPHAAAKSQLDGGFQPSQKLQGIRLARATHNADTEAGKVEIPVDEWAEQIVYVKALEIPIPRTIVCRVRYEISLEQDPQKKSWTEKQHSFRVPFLPSFNAEVDYVLQPAQVSHRDPAKQDGTGLIPILEQSQLDEEHGTVMIPALIYREIYLMSTRVNNEGPWPVKVKEVKLVIGSAADASVATQDGSTTASSGGGLTRNLSISRAKDRKRALQEAGVHVELIEDGSTDATKVDSAVGTDPWQPSNLRTFNHLVRLTAADLALAPEQIEVGYLSIQWKRYEEDESNSAPYTVTNVPLQPLILPAAEVYMTVDLPKSAQINNPFTARYEIHNPTGKLHELAMTVEPSEGMVYAGVMQTTIRVLPYSTHPLQMSCYPLSAGLVRLPRVKLVVNKRKAANRRGRHAPAPQQHGGTGYEEVLVKVRGATTMSDSTATRSSASSAVAASGDAVVIFVKPEAGPMGNQEK
ncbi:hypothetical protein BGZ51_002352 [Haplosporangium sp. Z 767]|nr:hypothetical protein BGZ51_002352 [Haplosporangium sp. Z 767]